MLDGVPTSPSNSKNYSKQLLVTCEQMTIGTCSQHDGTGKQPSCPPGKTSKCCHQIREMQTYPFPVCHLSLFTCSQYFSTSCTSLGFSCSKSQFIAGTEAPGPLTATRQSTGPLRHFKWVVDQCCFFGLAVSYKLYVA